MYGQVDLAARQRQRSAREGSPHVGSPLAMHPSCQSDVAHGRGNLAVTHPSAQPLQCGPTAPGRGKGGGAHGHDGNRPGRHAQPSGDRLGQDGVFPRGHRDSWHTRTSPARPEGRNLSPSRGPGKHAWPPGPPEGFPNPGPGMAAPRSPSRAPGSPARVFHTNVSRTGIASPAKGQQQPTLKTGTASPAQQRRGLPNQTPTASPARALPHKVSRAGTASLGEVEQHHGLPNQTPAGSPTQAGRGQQAGDKPNRVAGSAARLAHAALELPQTWSPVKWVQSNPTFEGRHQPMRGCHPGGMAESVQLVLLESQQCRTRLMNHT
jgi:hypothetical protein